MLMIVKCDSIIYIRIRPLTILFLTILHFLHISLSTQARMPQSTEERTKTNISNWQLKAYSRFFFFFLSMTE